MKTKAYLAIFMSHLTALIVLFTPIIRVTEFKMDILGQKIENSYNNGEEDSCSTICVCIPVLGVAGLWLE